MNDLTVIQTSQVRSDLCVTMLVNMELCVSCLFLGHRAWPVICWSSLVKMHLLLGEWLLVMMHDATA